MRNGNEPAFISQYRDGPVFGGLTKREYFAAMAMQGLMASDFHGEIGFDACALVAVKQADALLKALEETHETD